MTAATAPARESAIAMYLATYSQFADTAQLYAGTELGNTVAATAMLFLVAADAEMTDPEPSLVRPCLCEMCRLFVFADKSAPAMESFTGIGR